MPADRSVPCSRCGQPIPIDLKIVADPAPVVVCPHCGQRQVRKGSSASSSTEHSVGGGTQSGARQTQADVPTAAPAPLPAFSEAARPPETTTFHPPSSDFEAPLFAPDTLVAGRYRVVRLLARGGMGQVYEVEDLELHERLALKTVDPSIAREPGILDRFKREVHLARKVTHPNVCRLFDLGYHQLGYGREPVAFLTMELLTGQSLGARLRERGRLSPVEVLPLARQMAAGLQAAHDAGIVHRDFKPDNVFLVALADGSERAVITDFGIARPRSSQPEHSMLTLTVAGSVMGTPAYMAPEQVTGEEVGAAADQYAFAIVLYEMLSGELPFRGETPIATAAKRLTERPTSLVQLVPDLPAHWVAAISRALERDPSKRFSSVTAFVEALEHKGSVVLPSNRDRTLALPARSTEDQLREGLTPERKRSKRFTWGPRARRAVLAALLLVLLGVSGWAFWRVREMERLGAVERPALARKSLAILPLENLSGREDLQWLGAALAEMLVTELSQSREIRVLPAARVREWLEQGARAGPGSVGNKPAPLADSVLSGGFVALPGSDTLRLDLRLEDGEGKETRLSLAEQGTTSNLFELVERVGSKLRAHFGASAPSRSLASLFPRSNEASRLYVEALEAQRRGELPRARESLERVVALEPRNALAHAALAAVWSSLGYEQRAREAVSRALELAGALPEFDRLTIEARYAELHGDWTRAAALWRALRDSAPDVSDFTLALARAALSSGQPQQAAEAIEAYRGIPGLEADPRLDLEMGKIQAALGNSRGQLEAAQQALEAAAERRAPRLECEARLQLAWAHRQLGAPELALEEATRAAELAEQLGDPALTNQAASLRGALHLDRGELQPAVAVYEQALALARERGSRLELAQMLNNLAVALRRQGELQRALALYEEAAAVAREVGHSRGVALALTNQAAVLVEQGDLRLAEERLSAAIAGFRELQDRSGLAVAEASLGGVLRRKGSLDEAQKILERVLADRRKAGEKSAEFGLLLALGQLELDRGRIVKAEALLLEALALAEQLGQRASAAQARLALAEAYDLAGNPEDATKELLTGVASLNSVGQPVLADRGRLLLARLELRSNPQEALQRVEEIAARWKDRGPVELRALETLVRVEGLLALGQAAAALKELAARQGWVGVRRLEHERELLSARALLAAGKGKDAQERFRLIESVARQEGYLSVALEAAYELQRLGKPHLPTVQQLLREARELGLDRLASALERFAT